MMSPTQEVIRPTQRPLLLLCRGFLLGWVLVEGLFGASMFEVECEPDSRR